MSEPLIVVTLPVEAAEREAFASLLDTEDKAEGVASFLERRTPTWRGK